MDSKEEESKIERCVGCNAWGRVEEMTFNPSAPVVSVGPGNILTVGGFCCQGCLERMFAERLDKTERTLSGLKIAFQLQEEFEKVLREQYGIRHGE